MAPEGAITLVQSYSPTVIEHDCHDLGFGFDFYRMNRFPILIGHNSITAATYYTFQDLRGLLGANSPADIIGKVSLIDREHIVTPLFEVKIDRA
ncbi:hypothetical protein SAMN05444169_3850 [Bradyrhizobium erythrophlei]|uniref:Uncharacterized protein n=1 Tax=Bradyrhizobium erythrophlei TaxID=1437360 RepID=A0A1M5M7G5_9BRAD|nr:hypothetical protein SAMN05444169_3850 [Bradyrhizobium erythrophlei]